MIIILTIVLASKNFSPILRIFTPILRKHRKFYANIFYCILLYSSRAFKWAIYCGLKMIINDFRNRKFCAVFRRLREHFWSKNRKNSQKYSHGDTLHAHISHISGGWRNVTPRTHRHTHKHTLQPSPFYFHH